MVTNWVNDMGVKEIINRLYAYKDESNDERLNDLIDDVIKLIIEGKDGFKCEEKENGECPFYAPSCGL